MPKMAKNGQKWPKKINLSKDGNRRTPLRRAKSGSGWLTKYYENIKIMINGKRYGLLTPHTPNHGIT